MDIVKFCMNNDLTIEIWDQSTVESNPYRLIIGRISTLFYYNNQGQKRPVQVCTANEKNALKCLARLINKNIKNIEAEVKMLEFNYLTATVSFDDSITVEFTNKSMALYDLMGI